jgi:tetratricopeptide (TPR) repeat protein
MNRIAWISTLVFAALTGGGVGWIHKSDGDRAQRARTAVNAVAMEAQQRTLDVAFYEARAASDPESATDRARLASLYLQRARERGDHADYLRADSAARASLSLRRKHNEGALAVLASSLLAQHRFPEAREVAAVLVEAAPHVAPHRALLGETCLETGDYDCARRAFESIGVRERTSLAIAPRFARWAELRGDTAGARRIFRTAMTEVARNDAMPREQMAWFHLRAADLEVRQGRTKRAEALLQAGLSLSPSDHRLLSGMSRVAAAQRQWERAIAFGDSAIAIALDPATLGVVSDAYAALGDTAKAAEYFAAMEAAVGLQPGAYHRAWSLFLLDHDRRVPEVLAAAEAELTSRKDIHGYDLLAWALYKSGRPLEAREAMARALAQGTHDPLLRHHADVIAKAVADHEGVRHE